MRRVWKNKFFFGNLVALIFIKAIFSYSGFQFASLLDGVKIFGKEEVVAQTNLFRKTLGLNELKESSVLDIAAAQKLDDMKQGQYFAHTSPSGFSPWHWIEVNQYQYSYAGENLAIGFFGAKDTVDAWINSPTHRANLANSNYKEIGVAVAPAKIQNSEGFLVVQLFGTPKPTITAARATKTPAPTKLPPTPAKTTAAVQTSAPTHQLRPATTQIVSLPIGSPITELKEIKEPIASNITQPTSKLAQVGRMLDASLILYALLAFLVSVALLVFRELTKQLVVRTAASLAFLVLAVAIPVLQVSRTALIL